MSAPTPEQSSTVVLATILAQANIVLKAYEDEGGLASGKRDPAVVASLKATTEPLTCAIAALARAVAASVGYVAPPTKGTGR